MGSLIHQLRLLSQHSPLDSVVDNLGSGLRQRSTRMTTQDMVKMLLLFAVAFVAVWAMGRLWNALSGRLRKTRGWLFFRLCRAHGLRWRDHWLLWQVAREYKLFDPATLFIQPELLQTSAMRLLDPAIAARLAELQARLFAASESAVSPAASLIRGPAAPARKAALAERRQAPLAPPPVGTGQNAAALQADATAFETAPAATPLLSLTAKSAVDVASWFPDSATAAGNPQSPST